MKKRLSIILVDDDPPPRKIIVGLVRATPGFHVLVVSAELEALAPVVRETQPDLVLLSLGRKGKDRLRFVGKLHGTAPNLPLIIMGLSPRRENVAGLVRAGVAGFIMAGAPLDEYLSTILLVSNGGRVLPSDLTHALFIQLRRRPRALSVVPSFRPSVLSTRS